MMVPSNAAYAVSKVKEQRTKREKKNEQYNKKKGMMVSPTLLKLSKKTHLI